MADLLDPAAFLSGLEPFGGWNRDAVLGPALAALASRCELWSFRQDDIVQFPDEAPGGRAWVVQGCLVAEAPGAAPVFHGPTERWDLNAGAWVRGKTDGRFVRVTSAAWRAWLAAYPAAAVRLGEPAARPLPRGLLRSPLALEPGETPLHLFRQAPAFLAAKLALPGAFLAAFLAFGLVLDLAFAASVPRLLLWFFPAAGAVVAGAGLGLGLWEWSVSVLVVTDRSVLIRQIDLAARRSDFEKLPLEAIREAVFVRRGLIDTLLGLVALELEGGSPNGRLVFSGLRRTNRFLTAFETLRQERASRSPVKQAVRQALAARLGGARAPVLERPARGDDPQAPRVRRWGWRVEEGPRVWFRRHPWRILRRSAGWLLVAGLLVFGGVLVALRWPAGTGAVAGVTGLALLVPLARVGWDVWDWVDDRLSVEGERVIMVHRRPLWLGEVRQEGRLDQIQQIGVRKDSLASLLLDFGTVTVSLGTGDPLVFEDASHPEWVQAELFHRRTAAAQDREIQAAQARLAEVAEIVGTWDEGRRAGYFKNREEHA